jgi:uridine phosphorylase
VSILKRFIDPAALVKHRLGGRPAPRWRTALIAFRDHQGTMMLSRAFRGRPWRHRMLGGGSQIKSRFDVFEGRLGRERVGIVGYCGWGGPQAAIVVEELAAIGVKRIIGYGACGGLAPALPRGSVVAADRALLTDGTSLAYTRGTCRADPALLAIAVREARTLGIPLGVETCATVDALYRETPAAVRGWRRMGAGIINMETTPMYAAARACGVQALWLGFVSDRLVGRTWDHWYRDSRGGPGLAARLCLAVAKALARR